MILPASHESIPVDEIPVFIATFLHPGESGDPVWPLEGPADYPKYKEIGTDIGPGGERVTILRDLRTEMLVRRYACIAEYRTIVSHAIASGELRAIDPLTCLPINLSKGNAIRYDLPEFDRNPMVSREEFLRWVQAIGLLSPLSPNGAEHTGQPTSVGITAPLWGLVTAAPEALLKQPEIAHKDAEIEREHEAKPASDAPSGAPPVSPAAVIQKPIQRTPAQDTAIMAEILHLQLDHLAMPIPEAGKSGARAAVRKSMIKRDAKGYAGTFSSLKVYETAWQRLRDSKKICDK